MFSDKLKRDQDNLAFVVNLISIGIRKKEIGWAWQGCQMWVNYILT